VRSGTSLRPRLSLVKSITLPGLRITCRARGAVMVGEFVADIGFASFFLRHFGPSPAADVLRAVFRRGE
jgi:hypothetical protein